MKREVKNGNANSNLFADHGKFLIGIYNQKKRGMNKMKFIVRNPMQLSDETEVYFWLEKDGSSIVLKAQNSESVGSWFILRISADGLFTYPAIEENLGFKRDSINRIEVIE